MATTYTPHVGEHIKEIAIAMVFQALDTNDVVEAKLNDIELTAKPDSEPDEIVAYYMDECERRAEAYTASPEGQQAAQERKNRIARDQAIMDQAMVELNTLDFTNLSAVIGWLEKIRAPSEHIGVDCPAGLIVKSFTSKGFYADANCGENFKADDEENVARWIIGQALSCLSGSIFGYRAIHQVFDHFAEEWRIKFGHMKL